MKLKKLQIWSMLSLLVWGAWCGAPKPAIAVYNPEDVTMTSASRFWALVTDDKLPNGEDIEYIICGERVCLADEQRCETKVNMRYDHATEISNAAYKAGVAVGGAATGVAAVTLGTALPTALPVMATGAGTAAVAKGFQAMRGTGTVTNYEYRCMSKNAPLEKGWTEASESNNNWVKRRKVRTEGWFSKGTVKERGFCSKPDTQGRTYCLVAKNGMTSVNYDRANTAFKGCEVLPVKLYNARRCYFCPLFAVVYRVAGNLTAISFENLAAAFAVVLLLGWAIWVAVQTLTQVSSLTKQDAPKFLTGLIKQSYKVLIAFALLQYSTQIFHYGITPLLKAGLDFGNTLLDERYMVVQLDPDMSDKDKVEDMNPGLLQRVKSLDNIQYFDADLYVKIDNFVVNVQRNISFMQQVGTSLACIGGKGMVKWGSSIKFGQGFVMVVQGTMIAAFAFVMTLAFAFYMIDAVAQLGILGALLPFLIATWPFKLTAKYAKVGWNMLLNSAFIFVLIGLVVTVDLSLISSAVNFTATTQKTEDTIEGSQCTDEESCAKKEVSMGGLYELAQAINTQDEARLVELTDISSTGFLILLFCCIFGFMFMQRTQEMAGKFAGGALKPIAPSIATIGGSAAKSLALKTTQSTREAVANKVKAGGRAAIGAVGGLFHSKKNAAEAEDDEEDDDDDESPEQEDDEEIGADTDGELEVAEASGRANRRTMPRFSEARAGRTQTPAGRANKAEPTSVEKAQRAGKRKPGASPEQRRKKSSRKMRRKGYGQIRGKQAE